MVKRWKSRLGKGGQENEMEITVEKNRYRLAGENRWWFGLRLWEKIGAFEILGIGAKKNRWLRIKFVKFAVEFSKAVWKKDNCQVLHRECPEIELVL